MHYLTDKNIRCRLLNNKRKNIFQVSSNGFKRSLEKLKSNALKINISDKKDYDNTQLFIFLLDTQLIKLIIFTFDFIHSFQVYSGYLLLFICENFSLEI